MAMTEVTVAWTIVTSTRTVQAAQRVTAKVSDLFKSGPTNWAQVGDWAAEPYWKLPAHFKSTAEFRLSHVDSDYSIVEALKLADKIAARWNMSMPTSFAEGAKTQFDGTANQAFHLSGVTFASWEFTAAAVS